MALRPMTMLLASCWALLAITQDASGTPTYPGRIAATKHDTGQTICQPVGPWPICQPVRVAYNRHTITDLSTFDHPRHALMRDAAVSTPRPKPATTGSVRRARVATGHGSTIVDIARKYMGLGERSDRKALTRIFARNLDQRIDPVRTPWCAAFINAVLAEAGLPTSGSNMGISFAGYGRKVKTPQVGDIVVIRGGRNSRTHVGIYVGTEMRGRKKYIKLLGGNQSNSVKITSYLASKVIAIRRAG